MRWKYVFKYLSLSQLTYSGLECVGFMSEKTFGTTVTILSRINHPTQHCCHEIKVFVVYVPEQNKTTITAFKTFFWESFEYFSICFCLLLCQNVRKMAHRPRTSILTQITWFQGSLKTCLLKISRAPSFARVKYQLLSKFTIVRLYSKFTQFPLN